MKLEKAWPESLESKSTESKSESKVFPKQLVDSTVQKSLNSLLNETFEDPEEEVIEIKKKEKERKQKKIRVQNNLQNTFDTETQLKYMWITIAVFFLLSFFTLNSILCKLKILESLISRQS